MPNFYEQIFLLDSSVDITQLDFKTNSKIISFDYQTHKKLLEKNIIHEISDDYISKNDLDDILTCSQQCAYWYLIPELKEIITFEKVNLGELFFTELKEFLISFLKYFLEIRLIFQQNKKSNFYASFPLFQLISTFSNKTKIIGKNIQKLSIHNSIDIPINFAGKHYTITMSISKAQKVKKILDKLTKLLIKTNFKPNRNSFLLIDFTTIKNKSFFEKIPNYDLNIIKYDRNVPPIWNLESYSIIKNSQCVLENHSTLINKPIEDEINQYDSIIEKKIQQLLNSEHLLSFFSLNNISFWLPFKSEFEKMCRQRFFDAIKEFIILSKLFTKYSFSAILLYGETSLSQQLVIAFAKKLDIPIVLLEHGLNCDSPELIKNNEFYKFPPKNSDFILAWGSTYNDYLIKYNVNPKKIFQIGSPFFDTIFNDSVKPSPYQNYVLFAPDPYAMMYPHELTVEFMSKYESVIKKVYEIASKHHKTLVIKTHPQKNANEDIIAKQIDPSIITIKSGDILPLIKSCDFVIVTDMSTVILESQAMKKPVVSILLRDYYGTPEPFKSNLCERIDITELDDWVTKILTSSDFQTNIISKGEKFVNLYISNHGKASEKLLSYLENFNKD